MLLVREVDSLQGSQTLEWHHLMFASQDRQPHTSARLQWKPSRVYYKTTQLEVSEHIVQLVRYRRLNGQVQGIGLAKNGGNMKFDIGLRNLPGSFRF